jgi:hypothetical protein
VLAEQSAGLVHAVLPVQQIIEETVAQFQAIGACMGQLAARTTFG